MDYINDWITNPGFHHIAKKIFMDLDLKSVANVRKVCKKWNESEILLQFEFCILKQNILACRSIDTLVIMIKNPQDFGIDFNAADQTGNTILHYACKYGNLKVVELLLKHSELNNINLNRPNKKLQTPLCMAYLAYQLDTMKVILEYAHTHGINVDFGSNNFIGWPKAKISLLQYINAISS